MQKKFDKISSETIETNPYWVYKHDKYIMPNDAIGDYYYVETPGSIMVIPKLNDGRFVLVRQYRYLNQLFSLEFPGGGMKSGISPELNAREELSQEAGLITGNISKIGEFNPFNGVTNEICNVFIAEDLSEVKSSPDESEEFDVIRLSFDEINELIRSNEIWDGMTLSAWSLYVFSNFRSNINVF